jgi:hypothetical protein
MLAAGIDFLFQAGLKGTLEDDGALVLNGYKNLLKETQVTRKFLAGLEKAGLVISASKDGDSARLNAARFPAMLPAMHTLAAVCAPYDPAQVGLFHFARGNFAAVQGAASITPLELYRYFSGSEYDTVMQLHAYFIERGYQTICEGAYPFAWVVKYQGSRKIKSTPLFQIDYDERHTRPLRMQIKCASTNRLTGVLPLQPQALQDDFFQRVFTCNGDKCGWCRTRKSLGPSELTNRGETRTVCWFSNSDIRKIDANTLPLIALYEQMHASLAPV